MLACFHFYSCNPLFIVVSYQRKKISHQRHQLSQVKTTPNRYLMALTVGVLVLHCHRKCVDTLTCVNLLWSVVEMSVYTL